MKVLNVRSSMSTNLLQEVVKLHQTWTHLCLVFLHLGKIDDNAHYSASFTIIFMQLHKGLGVSNPSMQIIKQLLQATACLHTLYHPNKMAERHKHIDGALPNGSFVGGVIPVKMFGPMRVTQDSPPQQ